MDIVAKNKHFLLFVHFVPALSANIERSLILLEIGSLF